MIELCRRMRNLLVIALAAVWLATLACAEMAVEPSTHHQRHHLPCCPRSGTQGAQCSSIQCVDQAFQKSDARYAAEAPAIHHAVTLRPSISLPSFSSFHELVPGLFYRASVFRLKDDFRI